LDHVCGWSIESEPLLSREAWLSLLMFNIERWNLPQDLPDQNVVGVRWAASF
jgi:hypothetical protein